MSAEQTPDIETVLAEHRHPGELLTCLGDAWLVCSCGERIDLPVQGGIVNTEDAARRFAAHVAQALAPVLAAAVREAEQRALRDWIAGFYLGLNPRAALLRVATILNRSTHLARRQ